MKKQNDWDSGFTNIAHLHEDWHLCERVQIVQTAFYGKIVLVATYWV